MTTLRRHAGARWSFSGLSTGFKMLLILTAALLPLGMIALAASIQSAHAKKLQREADTRIVATSEARQIDILLLRGTSLLRSTLALGELTDGQCRRHLRAEEQAFHAAVKVALFAPDGHLRCATPGFSTTSLSRPDQTTGTEVQLLDAPGSLRFAVAANDGSYAVGDLPDELLAQILPSDDPTQGIVLAQGKQRLRLSSSTRVFALGSRVRVNVPIAGGQAQLQLTATTNPISAVEILLVLLPLLMWAAAAGIGWIVVDQLLLRPLSQLQRAVQAYGSGHGPLELPRVTTPSQEIRALGDAFGATATTLAHREEELQEGLRHQMRLTREVHHRVKNNLQVVASLINLHSRDASGDVAAAYASIQRRVDALAVVHRNHYAELEENNGVALRSILGELTANLRATAPATASGMSISLEIVPAFVTQDVAVPVSFLVTETVELVMTCDPGAHIAIALSEGPSADRALLSIEAAGLSAERCLHDRARDRFERIVTGLSRQLRAPLDYDPAVGRYAIALPIIPQPVEPA